VIEDCEQKQVIQKFCVSLTYRMSNQNIKLTLTPVEVMLCAGLLLLLTKLHVLGDLNPIFAKNCNA
jgi:hypothetical protein